MSSLETNSIETELRMGTPRPVRFRTRPQFGRALLWIFVLGVALLISALSASDLSELNALRKRGKPSTATVIAKHYTSGRSTSYYLDYIFDANGSVISDTDSVSWSLYSRSHAGTTLQILYLPDMPHIHRFPPVDNARIGRAILAWSGGFLLFVGLFTAALVNCEVVFRRQYRLLRFGEAVRAEITGCVPPVKGAKSQLYTIAYRYTVPMYGTQEGTASVSVKLGQWLSQKSHVTVLFDPQRVQTSRMYAALNTVELPNAPPSIPRF